MPVRDTIALLRDLNPVEAHPPPRQVPPDRRRGAQFVLLAATTTAAVVLGLVASSDERRAPGLAEAAYATLTAPERILHLRLHSQFHFPHDQSATTELWTRAAGRQLRVVFDGGEHEFVRDTDKRYAASYVRDRNQVTVLTEPEMWQVGPAEELSFAGPEGARRLADALPALLVRARNGDREVRRLPDAKLNGRTTARLQARTTIHASDQTSSESDPPDLKPVTIRTVVWLDLATHLPHRIESFYGDRRATTTDVVLAERLKVVDATELLLEMPPYRDATRVVGGRA